MLTSIQIARWHSLDGAARVRRALKVQARPFTEAREFARSLKLKSQREWRAYCTSGEKPKDIPSHPEKMYKDFAGYGDWLGTGNIAPQDMKCRPFKQARAFARSLKLKSQAEWRAYCKCKKPDDIPGNPRRSYKEFAGYGDWLGNEGKGWNR